MKRAGRSKTSRELAAISSSFLKVRILQYTAAAPATAVAIAERLRRHGARADPAPVLVRMTHCGLLRAQAAPGSAQRGRQYSLTPTGRRLLAVARKHLQQLGAQQFTHGNTTHSTT